MKLFFLKFTGISLHKITFKKSDWGGNRKDVYIEYSKIRWNATWQSDWLLKSEVGDSIIESEQSIFEQTFNWAIYNYVKTQKTLNKLHRETGKALFCPIIFLFGIQY